MWRKGSFWFQGALVGKLRSRQDWQEVKDTIRAWCETGFSLVKASSRLHVHRNTLIYRLEKIKSLTDYDIRDFRTCFNLYFALILDEYSGPAMKEKEPLSGEGTL